MKYIPDLTERYPTDREEEFLPIEEENLIARYCSLDRIQDFNQRFKELFRGDTDEV